MVLQISAEANRRTQRLDTFVAERDELVRLFKEDVSNRTARLRNEHRALHSSSFVGVKPFSWSNWKRVFQYHKMTSKLAVEELCQQSRLYVQYEKAFWELTAQSGFDMSSSLLREFKRYVVKGPVLVNVG